MRWQGRRTVIVALLAAGLAVSACSGENAQSRRSGRDAAPTAAASDSASRGGTSAGGSLFGGASSTAPAAPATTTVTVAPSPTATPRALGVRNITAYTSEGQRTYRMTLWATDDLTDCAAHSTGQLVAYFRAHPCRAASRYLWTFDFHGRTVVLSAVGMIAASGPSDDDPYKWSALLRKLELAPNTGGIKTIVEDGHPVPGIATQVPAAEVFVVTGQDTGVNVYDAWYLHGSTDTDDKPLSRLLSEGLQVSEASAVRGQ